MKEPVWVEKAPVPCRATGRDDSGGPFVVEDIRMFRAEMTAEGVQLGSTYAMPLVASASYVRRMCDAPGSPFVLLTRDQFAEMNALAGEHGALTARVAELEAELESARALESTVDKVLSNGLLERLDERFAKKTGPKPKAAA